MQSVSDLLVLALEPRTWPAFDSQRVWLIQHWFIIKNIFSACGFVGKIMGNFWAVMRQEADVLASLKAGRKDLLCCCLCVSWFWSNLVILCWTCLNCEMMRHISRWPLWLNLENKAEQHNRWLWFKKKELQQATARRDNTMLRVRAETAPRVRTS